MNSKITYLLSAIVVILVILLVATFPSNTSSQSNTEKGTDVANTTSEQETQNNTNEQDTQNQQSTTNEKPTPSLKGDFTKLVESSKDLGKLAVGNTKEMVTKTFNAKPIKSAKLYSAEYDYYERYELKEGKYDIYYKANKLVGATAF